MLLGVAIPGDVIGPQRPAAAAAPLGRFHWVDAQKPAARSSIKSQQPRGIPSDARYALLHKLDADLPARHSQAAALANPLARNKEKAPSKIGRGL